MHSWHFEFVIADVGLERPTGMSPIARRVAQQFYIAPYQEGVDNEEEIARNLDNLTRGIQEYALMEDIPRRYQRNRVEVSNRIRRLLTRVVRAVTCYHEHNVE